MQTRFAKRWGWLIGAILVLSLARPLHAEADLAEGVRNLYRGNYEAARSCAEGYLKVHPQATAARLLLARVEIAQGKYSDAHRQLTSVLRSEPGNIDALYYLSRVCTILSQEQYRQLFAMAPDSYRAHLIMAEAYMAQQNKPKAEEEYQAALKANPRSVRVLDALGDIKRTSYKFDEAVTYYGRAAEVAPGDYDSAYGLGACALFQNQPQRAVKHFRRALAAVPDSAAAQLALGDALLRADQPGDAVTELKKAVAMDPTMRQAYTLLARAYHRLGQTQAAKEALRKEQELARAKSEAVVKTLATDDLIAPLEKPPATTEPPQPER